jgi:hypothetical protein
MASALAEAVAVINSDEDRPRVRLHRQVSVSGVSQIMGKPTPDPVLLARHARLEVVERGANGLHERVIIASINVSDRPNDRSALRAQLRALAFHAGDDALDVGDVAAAKPHNIRRAGNALFGSRGRARGDIARHGDGNAGRRDAAAQQEAVEKQAFGGRDHGSAPSI